MNSTQKMPKLPYFMASVLKIIAALGIVKTPRRKLPELISDDLNLSEELRIITKKNGTPIYIDRTGWALTYLKRAKLIDFPKNGDAQITERGKSFLNNDGQIKVTDLMVFPDFNNFYYPENRKTRKKDSLPSPELPSDGSIKIESELNHNIQSINVSMSKELFFCMLKAMPSNAALINIEGRLSIIERG